MVVYSRRFLSSVSWVNAGKERNQIGLKLRYSCMFWGDSGGIYIKLQTAKHSFRFDHLGVQIDFTPEPVEKFFQLSTHEDRIAGIMLGLTDYKQIWAKLNN
jgi:hypothetical protein